MSSRDKLENSSVSEPSKSGDRAARFFRRGPEVKSLPAALLLLIGVLVFIERRYLTATLYCTLAIVCELQFRPRTTRWQHLLYYTFLLLAVVLIGVKVLL